MDNCLYMASVFLQSMNEYVAVCHVVNNVISTLPLGSIASQSQLLTQTLGVQVSRSHAQMLVVH